MKMYSSFIFNAAEVISFSPGPIQTRFHWGTYLRSKFHFSLKDFRQSFSGLLNAEIIKFLMLRKNKSLRVDRKR